MSGPSTGELSRRSGKENEPESISRNGPLAHPSSSRRREFDVPHLLDANLCYPPPGLERVKGGREMSGDETGRDATPADVWAAHARCRQRVVASLRGRSRDLSEQDAEDLAAEACARLAARVTAGYRADAERLPGLLHRTATNLALDRLRHRQRFPSAPVDPEHPGPTARAEAERVSEARALRDCLDTLPGAQVRSLIEQAYGLGWDGELPTFERVGRSLGWSKATTCRHHLAALRWLRTCLERKGVLGATAPEGDPR